MSKRALYVIIFAVSLLGGLLINSKNQALAQVVPGKETCFFSDTGDGSQVIGTDGKRWSSVTRRMEQCVPVDVLSAANYACDVSKFIYSGNAWLNKASDGKAIDPGNNITYLAGYPDIQNLNLFLTKNSCTSLGLSYGLHEVRGFRLTDYNTAQAQHACGSCNGEDTWPNYWTPFAQGNRIVDSRKGDIKFLKVNHSAQAIADYGSYNVYHSTSMSNYCYNSVGAKTYCRMHSGTIPNLSLISVSKKELFNDSRCAGRDECTVDAYLMFYAPNLGSWPVYGDKVVIQIKNLLANSKASVTSFVNNKLEDTVLPGQTATFNHGLKVITKGGVQDTIKVSFSGSSITTSQSPKSEGINTKIGDPLQTIINKNYAETLTPTMADVGKKYCRTITWASTTSQTVAEGATTATSCVTVIAPTCNYSFAAPATAVSPASVEVNNKDANLTVTYTHNPSNATRSGNVNTCYAGKTSQQTTNPASTSKNLYRDRTNTGNFTSTRAFSATSLDGATLCRRSVITPGSGNLANENGPAINGNNACATAKRVNFPGYLNTRTFLNDVRQASNINGQAYQVDASPGDILKFEHHTQTGGNTVDEVNIYSESWSGDITALGTVRTPQRKSAVVKKVAWDISRDNNRGYIHPQVLPVGNPIGGVALVDTNGKIRSEAVGKQICQRVTIEPANSSLAGNFSLMINPYWACINIPYRYTLIPKIELDGNPADTSSTPGESIPITGKVDKGSNDTWSRDTQWQLTTFVIPKGSNPKPGADNTTVPCTYFGNNCQILDQGNGQVFKNTSEDVIKRNTPPLAELEIGTKVCFALSVQPFSHDSLNWRHSEPRCITVSKAPKAQIHGSSLMVPGGKVQASVISIINNTASHTPCIVGTACRYGSWMEYDILARGAINNSASAAGFPSLTADPIINRHRLSFANIGNNYGNYYSGSEFNQANQITNYYLSQAGTPNARVGVATPSLDIRALADSSANQGKFDIYYQRSSTPLALLSSAQPTVRVVPVNQTKTVVIVKESGDLHINNNLTYQPSGITSLRSQPQLILIAKNGNIIIDAGVTQVDAWLVATGSDDKKGHLQTCNPALNPTNRKPTNLSAAVCNQKLTINGPVIVDYLDLYRTHGSEVKPINNMDQPAELFNFRPDAYLWSYANSSPNKVILETTYTRELPVRY